VRPALSCLLALGCGGVESGAQTDTGTASTPTAPRATLVGSQDGGRFGISVATLPASGGGAGWVAAASAVGTMRQGAVWMGDGAPPEGVVQPGDAAIAGERDIERLGQAMAVVPDRDGDGLAELVLGGVHLGDPSRMHGGCACSGATAPAPRSWARA
jgi:hypothetical protein